MLEKGRLLNQTYKNIEIIVRDDGSKDNTVAIVKEYMEKKSNIILHHIFNFVNKFLLDFFVTLSYNMKYQKLQQVKIYAGQDDLIP